MTLDWFEPVHMSIKIVDPAGGFQDFPLPNTGSFTDFNDQSPDSGFLFTALVYLNTIWGETVMKGSGQHDFDASGNGYGEFGTV